MTGESLEMDQNLKRNGLQTLRERIQRIQVRILSRQNKEILEQNQKSLLIVTSQFPIN